MAIQRWSGHVAANSQQPVNTGLNFTSTARVVIVSQGWAEHNPESGYLGPSGVFRLFEDDAASAQHRIGALLVKTGTVYTEVGGGLADWSPPTDDNMEFVFNDTVPEGYGDNVGGFDVTLIYDDEDLLHA